MTREPDMPTYYELHTEVERLVGIVAVRNDEAGKLRAEIERLRAALITAPRPHPAIDVVVYADWFFKTRIAALALEPKP